MMDQEISDMLASPVVMAGLEFLPVISFGHVLTFGATVVGASIFIGKFIQSSRQTKQDLDTLRTDVRKEYNGLSRDLRLLRSEVRGLTTALLSFKMSGAIEDIRDPEEDNNDDLPSAE